MNGVLIVSTRTGTCLYARAYLPDFGLPTENAIVKRPADDDDDAAGSAGGDDDDDDDDDADASVYVSHPSDPAAMHFAGLMFAIDAQAQEMRPPGDGDGEDGDEADGEDGAPMALERWSLNDVVMHFRRDDARGVLVVLFSAPALGDAIPSSLARGVLAAFLRKHAAALDAPGGPTPGRRLPFTSDLHALFHRACEERAREMMKSIGLRSRWAYVAMSDAFGVVAPAEAPPRGSGVRVGGVSRASFVVDDEEEEEEEEASTRKGSAADVVAARGGWLCCCGGGGGGKKVTPAFGALTAADVGRVQFVHRVAGDALERAAASFEAGAASTDDILPRRALDALVEATRAAIALARGGGAVGFEIALGDGGDERDDDDDASRVLVFAWDGFVFALPVTRADERRAREASEARVGAGGYDAEGNKLDAGRETQTRERLHPAAVRAAVNDDATSLRAMLRFVRRKVPEKSVRFTR
jgi:hypothetical protein